MNKYTRNDFVPTGEDGEFFCPSLTDGIQSGPTDNCPCKTHGNNNGTLTRMQMMLYLTDPLNRTITPK